MADAEELERALLARWDRETLLVYADCLQAAGDPRGELIVIDLHELEHSATAERVTRRRKLLYEWLGGSTICNRPWNERSFRCGFVDDFFVTHDRNGSTEDYLNALLASPAGRFVRGLTIMTSGLAELREALAVIVRAEWRWLERLAISVVEATDTIGEKLVAALVQKTPRLRVLDLSGARALAAFPHPAVRELSCEASNTGVVRSLGFLDRLDVVFDDDDDELFGFDSNVYLRAKTLDLSRTEPRYPPTNPPDLDIFPFARRLALRGVRTLRLPSLRTATQLALVQELLDIHPTLEIEIARTYDAFVPTLVHARLRIPPPRPWPAPDTVSSRDALTITLPTEEYGDDLALSRLIEILEDQFERLTPPIQAAWVDFWRFLAGLGWEDASGSPMVLPYPADQLLEAVEPLTDVVEYSGTLGGWAQLGEKLRAADLPPGATVTIRRYWGW